VGSVFAALIVISSRPFAGQADILLFVGMIVGAVNLLLSQNENVPSLLRALVVVVFGALLVVAGILMLGKRLSRPTT
jgi:sulfite exporter TauE/SafE